MDYYETLGITKASAPDDIKKAYRKLASQHHPDKGGDTATFQRIEEAYRTLSDPQKKQQYDSPPPQGMPGGFPGGFHFQPGQDLNDIFNNMFGQGVHIDPRQPRKQVFRTQINISLEDSYLGNNHILKIQTTTGIKVVNIEIPKGIGEGEQLRYDNVIDNATLMVEFRFIPNLKFDRKGNDLYCNHSISVLDLIVGTSFEFTTMSGKTLEVAIQPKTQPHMQLKINGQGMPITGTSLFGDQILLLKPFIPATISDDIIDSILRNK
jgi:DnaJ-class molecular chaperone